MTTTVADVTRDALRAISIAEISLVWDGCASRKQIETAVRDIQFLKHCLDFVNAPNYMKNHDLNCVRTISEGFVRYGLVDNHEKHFAALLAQRDDLCVKMACSKEIIERNEAYFKRLLA